MIRGTLEQLKTMKDEFINDPNKILDSFRDDRLTPVRMEKSSQLGCKVKIGSSFFVMTPQDIEKMPSKTRGVFEDIFDELLQESVS